MQSMTGYGKSEVLLPDQKITVEIKSLNSKNIDVNLKMPNKYREKELDIRKMIQSRLNRGKIDVILFSEMNAGNSPVNINRDSFKQYYEQISELAAELGLHTGSEIIDDASITHTKIMSRADFVDLFTQAEFEDLLDIENLPPAAQKPIRALIKKLELVDTVNIEDARIQQLITGMVQINILTQARADVILLGKPL